MRGWGYPLHHRWMQFLYIIFVRFLRVVVLLFTRKRGTKSHSFLLSSFFCVLCVCVIVVGGSGSGSGAVGVVVLMFAFFRQRSDFFRYLPAMIRTF